MRPLSSKSIEEIANGFPYLELNFWVVSVFISPCLKAKIVLSRVGSPQYGDKSRTDYTDGSENRAEIVYPIKSKRLLIMCLASAIYLIVYY